MRDIAVLIFLIGAIVATFRKPWYGVLALAVFSYMNPHAFAWGFMSSMPVYQILFLAVFASFLTAKDKQPLPKDWRITTFFLLWAYFFITTLSATVPEAAWPKLVEVSKIYLPFILTLFLINTREKLYYLIITITASFGLLTAKGGIWAIGSGFSFRVYGPPGTQFFENNAFAVVACMTIPLLILWYRESSHKWLRYALVAAVPLSMASALSSWSRGGLLALGVTTIVLLWHSKRKYLVAPLLVVGLILAGQVLPEEWFNRMESIQDYDTDKSAQGRLVAWEDGINYAIRNPLTGAGFEGWRDVTSRDWHSSYVEILAEHGVIAFALWFSLLAGSIISLGRLPPRVKKYPDMAWVGNYCYMLRASILAYAVGTIFLGLSYWDIFYHLVFISVLVKKFALEELAQHEANSGLEPRAAAPVLSPQPGRT